MFLVLKIFIPPFASVQLKTEAYHHLLPRVLTPETIESEKKKKKKIADTLLPRVSSNRGINWLYCLGSITTEA